MYKIHFDPILGRFVVKVSQFGFFWVTVNIQSESKKAQNLIFETYDAAIEHIKQIGLDKLYEDRSANKYRDFVKGNDMMTQPELYAKGKAISEKFYTDPGLSHG